MERVCSLLGAAARVDYLYVSTTPISELLAPVGSPVSPTLLHLSSFAEDVGILPPQLDLSNCRSLYLSLIKWLLPATIKFLGLLSKTLRSFHYMPLPYHRQADKWLPPSTLSSLEVLETFSLSIKTSARGDPPYRTNGLYWMSEAVPHLQTLSTLKSIRVDTDELPPKHAGSKWDLEPEVVQALSELGRAFKLLSGCKITFCIDSTMLEMYGNKSGSIDVRACLSRSQNSNDIQIRSRSFVQRKPIKPHQQPAFHFHPLCKYTGSTSDCGCWSLARNS
ncbi:hypothetical protein DL96DRAFT_1606952 [Flagelloscypha sp. PMI_526]|nr:hypothetical protein DL96DRAFT_1606952 [Flagelloscypha sp. PMI_526]